MKKSIRQSSVYTFALLVFAIFSLNAQIRRVNNTPGLNDPNVYATAQAAYDAPGSFQTISLEPSANPNYGDLNIYTPINIVGTGYYLDKNPSNTFDKRQTTLSNVYFGAGSFGSSITGVKLNDINIGDENITVKRCQLVNLLHVQGLHWGGNMTAIGYNSIIINNLITGNIRSALDANCPFYIDYDPNLGGPCVISVGENSTIENNIILGSIYTMKKSSKINYNTFICKPNIGNIFGEIKNSTITNNIFYVQSPINQVEILDAFCVNNVVLYNIYFGGNGLPIDGGNVNGANPDSTFVGISNPLATYNTNGDKDFQLAVGSLAITAGVGGTQAGAFGNGANAYRLSGVPAAPIITSFISTEAGNNNTPLNIIISIRSNN